MTRKDYVLLAAALASVRPQASERPQSFTVALDKALAVQHARGCEAIADALAAENARFDRARFLKACGIAE